MKNFLIVCFLLLLVFCSLLAYFSLHGGSFRAKCVHCPAINAFEEKYCAECGELTYELPICPKCHTKNVMDDQYCVGCASKLPRISVYLMIKNWFVQKRDPQRALERQKVAREYTERVDQSEALAKNEIQRQKQIQVDRENKTKAENWNRKQEEENRLQMERMELEKKRALEEQNKPNEKDNWKIKEIEREEPEQSTQEGR